MVLAGGVSAEGIRSARAASTWERIVAAVGIAEYIRLMFAYSVRRLQPTSSADAITPAQTDVAAP
jgi:hypothetical protein